MHDNLYGIFDEICKTKVSIIEESDKKIIQFGLNGKLGQMETYEILPGIYGY